MNKTAANPSLIYSSITEKKSSQIVSKVLSLTKRPMTEEEKRIFDSSHRGAVWELKRVRIVDQKVMELQESIFPKKIFPYFDQEMGQGSLQKLILDTGLSISHSLASFEAVNLSEQEARLFHERKNHAGMSITSRTISRDGLVVEYTKRLVIDYIGTFRLPFSKDSFNYRHQEDGLNDFL
ncbi:UTRA domain-containing protein [Enterococcus sp. LJL128]